jgi:hypothetical protein
MSEALRIFDYAALFGYYNHTSKPFCKVYVRLDSLGFCITVFDSPEKLFNLNITEFTLFRAKVLRAWLHVQ